MIKISLKYGGILGAVAIICTLAVSAIYVTVDPIIIARTAQKVRDNLNKIFVDVNPNFEYSEITTEYNFENLEFIDALYQITLADNSLNYVYKMSPQGRNAEIHFLIAYDTKGKVVKIQYVQMRETKGRGDKITKDDYLNSIYGQNASSMDVTTIAGATYSTKAMKQSIEASSKHLVSEVLQ